MDAQLEFLRSAIASGMSQSDLIGSMKLRGFSIIDAIKATRELFGIELADAKQEVTSHPAYREAASLSDPLHDDVIRAFQVIANSNDNSN